MKTRIWTLKEIDYLKEHYGILGIKPCAEVLNRTEDSVKMKAYKLKIKAPSRLKTHAQYESELFEAEINYYPIEEYINNATPILHECLNDHSWKVRPYDILRGVKCPTCQRLSSTKTHEQYLLDLTNKNIPYTPLESYVSRHHKILHQCNKDHQWSATPGNILGGTGCPICTKYAFDATKPAILYYIKFTDGISIYYKIGITNNTVKMRFSAEDLKKATILLEQKFTLGRDAKSREQQILFEHNKHRSYCDFISTGNTEVFEIDVLNLDT